MVQVTDSHIKIYNKYKGNIDDWARNNSKKEYAIMSDNDWYLIEGFVQDFLLVKKGLASIEFTKSFYDRLKEQCENDLVINKIPQSEH